MERLLVTASERYRSLADVRTACGSEGWLVGEIVVTLTEVTMTGSLQATKKNIKT